MDSCTARLGAGVDHTAQTPSLRHNDVVNFTVLAWILGAAFGLYGLHLAALGMERRGWIFYRDTKASSSSASNAFQSVQAIFEPGAQHTVEIRRNVDIELDESGDL